MITNISAILLLLVSASTSSNSSSSATSSSPRQLDSFSTGFMMEDGQQSRAAPECRPGLGWVYYSGHCYMFTSSHADFLQAE